MQSTNETWKAVVGHEGLYEVSSLGRVRGIDRYIPTINNSVSCTRFVKGKILKTSADEEGYIRINIQDADHKSHRYGVHRLVAAAFLPNPETSLLSIILMGIRTTMFYLI